MEISKTFLKASLVPNLSKVWSCKRLIDKAAEMPSGVVGERNIRLNKEETWVAFFQKDSDAWLEVKGAFLGSEGPYELGCWLDRAKEIQDKGRI